MVAVGSADRTVVVWDVASRKMVYKLPGHKGIYLFNIYFVLLCMDWIKLILGLGVGCVTEVDWHPKEPVLVSCSNDKTLFLGEVNPEEVRMNL